MKGTAPTSNFLHFLTTTVVHRYLRFLYFRLCSCHIFYCALHAAFWVLLNYSNSRPSAQKLPQNRIKAMYNSKNSKKKNRKKYLHLENPTSHGKCAPRFPFITHCVATLCVHVFLRVCVSVCVSFRPTIKLCGRPCNAPFQFEILYICANISFLWLFCGRLRACSAAAAPPTAVWLLRLVLKCLRAVIAPSATSSSSQASALNGTGSGNRGKHTLCFCGMWHVADNYSQVNVIAVEKV